MRAVMLRRWLSSSSSTRGRALWLEHRAAFKSPLRKATALLEVLKREELARRHKELPDFRAGDAIDMTMLWEVGNPKTTSVKGLVLGRTNRGLDSSVLLYCQLQNTPYIRRVPIYSPLVQAVKVIQRAFLHKGKKRVRRAKLTYLIKKGYNIRAP
ncbi:hypothetical protein CTAYLR_002448 [Chrysophaeum taylorii]|uniref:50S ribosomal protein L19, chloroplastic n=1 Tax=Chrysophaeum taylorii TaxID=2483200 RepID=A0AAD7UMJ5_9STRA|nr:hypothetical protein CTAYLR_002448 [Chrysophaeum taylorii]